MAICAAESLSVVTRLADDPIAKRLRLTLGSGHALGSGHGIATLLDSAKRSDDDAAQEASDAPARELVARSPRATPLVPRSRKPSTGTRKSGGSMSYARPSVRGTTHL